MRALTKETDEDRLGTMQTSLGSQVVRKMPRKEGFWTHELISGQWWGLRQEKKKGRGCGGLNEDNPHRLLCVNTWSQLVKLLGSGLVRVSVALLYVVCHGGWALSFQQPTSGSVFLCLQLVDKM